VGSEAVGKHEVSGSNSTRRGLADRGVDSVGRCIQKSRTLETLVKYCNLFRSVCTAGLLVIVST
jgi:hypothetical protein